MATYANEENGLILPYGNKSTLTIFHSGPPSHGGECKTFEVMTST